MKRKLSQRLQQLKIEYESGQKMLTEIEAKQANLRDTLLRISGAIQVLEEELAATEEPESSDDDLTSELIEVSSNSHG